MFLAASLPCAMAMEQSASFSTMTSLTPSPVMAVIWPLRFSASIICFFCTGDTRPNTV